ncbi:MAG: ABC transporter permease [Bdellovibrionales bacterium]
MVSVHNFWIQSKALTFANLKCRYRKTLAGFLWVFLNPLISFSVQAVAFGHFLKIDVHHYLLFLVAGLLPWMFIAQTLEMSVGIFVNSGSLIKSISASPLVYLSAQILDNLLNFIVAFLMILLLVSFFEGGRALPLLLLPLPLLSLVIGVFALAWCFAIAQVFFRDTRFLLSFALQAAFFLTPVFYPKTLIPPGLQWLTALNPLFQLIDPFQILIHDFYPKTFFLALLSSFLTSFILLAIAFLVWRRQKSEVFLHV